jgi:hypothetical protein
MEMNLSKKGLEFIVNQETGGRAYYEKMLKYPTWPGVESGVTIGVGWDCGYNTVSQLCSDWGALLDEEVIEPLKECCGLKGRAAMALLPTVKDIEIPWEAAVEVFNKHTVPRFYLMMLRTYPQAESLHPDAASALLSLIFNRGGSLNGERRIEMSDIKACLINKDYSDIPDLLRKMKRLWPDTAGLRKRRDAEAALFEQAYA